MCMEIVDKLHEEYVRLSKEASERYKVSHRYWTLPEFEAVREALDCFGYQDDYYWSWYARLKDEWRQLQDVAGAAEVAVAEAYRVYVGAYIAATS